MIHIMHVLVVCMALLGVEMVNMAAAAVKNPKPDTDLLSLSVSEHDWPLADSRGRRTSALCQSHQQRPAGIRHVTCTRHWCLYRLLHLARFLREKKTFHPKFYLSQKWLWWCCTWGKDFINLPKVSKLSVQVEVAHSMLRTVSMLVTCFPLDPSPESVSTVVWMNPKSHLSLDFVAEIQVGKVKRQRTYRRGFRSLLSWWWGNSCLWTSPHVWRSWSGPEDTRIYVTLTAQRIHSTDFSIAVFKTC